MKHIHVNDAGNSELFPPHIVILIFHIAIRLQMGFQKEDSLKYEKNSPAACEPCGWDCTSAEPAEGECIQPAGIEGLDRES